VIYFIQACGGDNLIKIGVSRAPATRFSSLLTASPVELELLLVMPGTRRQEQDLHRRFAHARVRGEWFRPIQPLLDYIASTPAMEHLGEIDPSMQPRRPVTAARVKRSTRALVQRALDAEEKLGALKHRLADERRLELVSVAKPTPILPFPPLSPERMTPELEELMRQAEAFRELGRR